MSNEILAIYMSKLVLERYIDIYIIINFDDFKSFQQTSDNAQISKYSRIFNGLDLFSYLIFCFFYIIIGYYYKERRVFWKI